jgi:ribonuclease-3
MDPSGAALKSPKSRLQEFTQRRTGSRPSYRVVDATGPDHEKLFRVEVVVEGRVLGAGEGSSRRVAETAAAVHALDELRAEAADLKRDVTNGGQGAVDGETHVRDEQPSQLSG